LQREGHGKVSGFGKFREGISRYPSTSKMLIPLPIINDREEKKVRHPSPFLPAPYSVGRGTTKWWRGLTLSGFNIRSGSVRKALIA
jgi:hypothetical protein